MDKIMEIQTPPVRIKDRLVISIVTFELGDKPQWVFGWIEEEENERESNNCLYHFYNMRITMRHCNYSHLPEKVVKVLDSLTQKDWVDICKVTEKFEKAIDLIKE